MAWNGSGGYNYTRLSVTRNAPAQSGVYMLYRSDEPAIYVGESGDISARLLEHIGGDNPCISRCAPTLFAYELVSGQAARVARQNVLIREWNPPCNPAGG